MAWPSGSSAGRARRTFLLVVYLTACHGERRRVQPEEFAQRVRDYCTILRCSVLEWQRTAERNEKLGDEKDSPHLYGLAADVAYDSPISPNHAFRVATRFRLRVAREQDHDHLEPIEAEE